MRFVFNPLARAGLVLMAGASAACAARTRPIERGPAPVDGRAAAAPAGPIDTAGLTRIRFARGTSSGILNDSLGPRATRSYLLGALQAQVMLAHAIAWNDSRENPPAGTTSVRVFEALDGRELRGAGEPGPLWFGHLPGTGDFVVRVTAGDAPVVYTLAVQIPRRVLVDARDPSASFTGTAPSHAPIDYLLAGAAGRTLEVELHTPTPGTSLHIYGLEDGIQLSRLAEGRQRYSGTLPSPQDYVISVVPGADQAPYDLRVTLR
jgi:hypothetical protein